MAEYREFHCPYGDDFEGGDKCDRCEQYELCMETPTADVIEQSKIDKVIEEIESFEYRDYGKMGFNVCRGKVLGILKQI